MFNKYKTFLSHKLLLSFLIPTFAESNFKQKVKIMRVKLLNIDFSLQLLISLSIVASNFLCVQSDAIPKLYFGETIALVLITIYLPIYIIKRKGEQHFYLTLSDITVLVLLIWICAIDVIYNDEFWIEQIIKPCALVAFFFICHDFNLKLIYKLIISIAIIQSFIAIYQYYSFDNILNMTGTFDTQVGFVLSLLLAIPIVYFYITQSKNTTLRNSLIAVLLIFVSLLIFTGSRLGLISMFLYTLMAIWWSQRKNKGLFLLALFVATSLFVLTFSFDHKRKSVIGRSIIYGTLIEMIEERPFIGYGSNGFDKHYMKFQARHLSANPEHSILADDIKNPISDLLYFVLSYGIVSLFILLIFLVSVFIAVIRKREKDISKQPIIAIMSSIALFFTFSYPFQYFYVTLIVIILMSKISSKGKATYDAPISVVYTVAFILCTTVLTISIKQVRGMYQYCIASELLKHKKTKLALIAYTNLEESMKWNSNFLYSYSALLNKCGLYAESDKILEEYKRNKTGFDLMILESDNAFRQKNYRKSISCLDSANAMVPARFLPLFLKVRVLLFENKLPQALRLAKDIVVKPEKIKSETTYQIKQEMKVLIKNLDKHE